MECDMKSEITRIKMKVPVLIFKEDSNTIAFCPVLDLSGYGRTEKEAKESFEIALDEFLEYTTKKKTIYTELKRLGWAVSGKGKKVTPPMWQDLLDKSASLNGIMAKDFKKFDRTLELLPG